MEASLKKCIQMLQQIKRDAGFVILSQENEDELRFCVQQYNRIYERLVTLDADLVHHFSPLAEESSAGKVRMAASDLMYFLYDRLDGPHSGDARRSSH